MALNFPSAHSEGQVYNIGNLAYVYSSGRWKAQSRFNANQWNFDLIQ